MDVINAYQAQQEHSFELVLRRGYLPGIGEVVYYANFKDFYPELGASAPTAHEAVRMLLGRIETNEIFMREAFPAMPPFDADKEPKPEGK